MSRPQNSVTLSFDCEMDERAEWEIRQKGYFEHSFGHFTGWQNCSSLFLGSDSVITRLGNGPSGG